MKALYYFIGVVYGIMALMAIISGESPFEPLVLSLLFTIMGNTKNI